MGHRASGLPRKITPLANNISFLAAFIFCCCFFFFCLCGIVDILIMGINLSLIAFNMGCFTSAPVSLPYLLNSAHSHEGVTLRVTSGNLEHGHILIG